jgi:hypothetical protein
MQCINPEELTTLFGPAGFAVMSNPGLRRTTLALKSESASRQKRIGGRPTPRIDRFLRFAEALNRWHATSQRRLLWVDHWADDFPSTHALFIAARAGLGEIRSISEAPGHLFDAYPYHERDQLKISTEQSRQTGILIGLMSLLMINGWDGWRVL